MFLRTFKDHFTEFYVLFGYIKQRDTQNCKEMVNEVINLRNGE